MYRECRKGSGGPPAPGGHMGCRGCALAYMGQGHQPQESHAPRDKKKGRVLKGEGTSEVPWGGRTPPWPHPSLEEGPRLCPPLSLAPIYSGGGGGQPHLKPWRLPPSRDTSSSPAGAWRSPAGLPRSSINITLLCCCWMESSSTSPSLLAGSRHGRRHRAVRVLNAEVASVRH